MPDKLHVPWSRVCKAKIGKYPWDPEVWGSSRNIIHILVNTHYAIGSSIYFGFLRKGEMDSTTVPNGYLPSEDGAIGEHTSIRDSPLSTATDKTHYNGFKILLLLLLLWLLPLLLFRLHTRTVPVHPWQIFSSATSSVCGNNLATHHNTFDVWYVLYICM